MKIEVLKEIPFGELERNIRSVPLLKSPDVFVYADANISLREFHVDEINPTSFYVIKDNLQRQKDLREVLLKKGIDSLHLDKAYEIKNSLGEMWTLMPPVIEVAERKISYVPQEDEIKYSDEIKLKIPVINDGMHRVFLAREEGESFNGVYVSGVMKEFPFYAHPNGWDMVKMVDEVPATKKEKKFYSRNDCYGLYRDFGVLGCGAPRGTSK